VLEVTTPAQSKMPMAPLAGLARISLRRSGPTISATPFGCESLDRLDEITSQHGSLIRSCA
jgi:hypothetical protein